MFFAQERNERGEMWTGRRLGPEGVKEKLKIGNSFDHKEFKDAKIDFPSFDKVMFYNFNNDVRDTGHEADLFDLIRLFKEKAHIPADFIGPKYRIYEMIQASTEENYKSVAEQIFAQTRWNPVLREDKVIAEFTKAPNGKAAQKIAKSLPRINLDTYTLSGKMGKLRMVKSPEEMKLLRKAIDVSCVGQAEVMKALHPDMSEMEIQGIHEYVYRKYGAEYQGYPSIVGAGYNGCILHYIENNRPMVGKDLVLMDLGAEYHGYTADVTRTVPASGKFSPEQKAIYDIVYEAQEAAFKLCKPGGNFTDITLAAKEVIDRRLAEIGVIQAGQEHNYLPHGISHHLGLDVHDKSDRSNVFVPGIVFTVEPGIYIPENSPCDKKWWGIAVRIEDDILITNDGYELLSKLAPRKSEEIEALMANPSALDDIKLPDLDGKRN